MTGLVLNMGAGSDWSSCLQRKEGAGKEGRAQSPGQRRGGDKNPQLLRGALTSGKIWFTAGICAEFAIGVYLYTMAQPDGKVILKPLSRRQKRGSVGVLAKLDQILHVQLRLRRPHLVINRRVVGRRRSEDAPARAPRCPP